MNLASLLFADHTAAARVDVPALVEPPGRGARVVTFGQLNDAVRRTTRRFNRSGLVPGDRMLVLIGLSIDLYVVVAAALQSGLVVVFPPEKTSLKSLGGLCRRVRPRAVAASSSVHFVSLFFRATRGSWMRFNTGPRLPGMTSLSRSGELEPEDRVCSCQADTPALLTFTSGSTGAAKATLRTHGFLAAQLEAVRSALELAPGRVELATMPVFVLANLAAGLTTILGKPNSDGRRQSDSSTIESQLRRWRVDRIAAAPAFLQDLSEHCRRHKRVLEGLKTVFTGGGPVFPESVRQIRRMAPNARVVLIYGSTEAEPIARIEADEVSSEDSRRMETGAGLLAGGIVPGIEVRILPDRWGTALGPYDERQFDSLSVPKGSPGEIVVTGAHVLTGYMDGQGDRETKIRVGDRIWHRTGDAGYLDDQSRLWLLGRCDAAVRAPERVFYPFAFEPAAQGVAGVGRAALHAEGDPEPKPVMIVEPDPDVDASSLAALRDSVREATGLDAVRFVDRMPVDPRHRSKIHYPALRTAIAKR